MAVFTIGTMIRVLLLVILVSTVWIVFSDQARGMKKLQHQAALEEIAKNVREKVVNAYSFIQDNHSSYQARLSLPPAEAENSVSLSCQDGRILVLAQNPAYSAEYDAVSNINCSGMIVNGSVSWGERCLAAENNGTTKSIRLVNYCAPV